MKPNIFKRLKFLLLVLITWLISNTNVTAQQCNLQFDGIANTELSYQSRGNRCEGTYKQKVSNRINVRVIGFHLNDPYFDLKKEKGINIGVFSYNPGTQTILQAISLRPDDYYQMDTSDLNKDGSFFWSFDVINQLATPIQPHHIAVVACEIDCDPDPTNTPLLLPVMFKDMAQENENHNALLFVVADVELRELQASLYIEDKVVFENQKIGGRFIPAKRAQRIPLKNINGKHASLFLSAITRSGQRDAYEATLLLPGFDKE